MPNTAGLNTTGNKPPQPPNKKDTSKDKTSTAVGPKSKVSSKKKQKSKKSTKKGGKSKKSGKKKSKKKNASVPKNESEEQSHEALPPPQALPPPPTSATDKIVADLLKYFTDNNQGGQGADNHAKDEEIEEDVAPTSEPSVSLTPVTQGAKNSLQINNFGWSDVPAVGKVIQNTRFICIKTPLDMALPTNPDYNAFTTEQLIQDHMASLGRTLGMVVDLTDTFKFYNPYDSFESKQIKHVKLFVPNNNTLPKREKVEQFNEIVINFLKDTEGSPDRNGEDTLVAVHCQTGINMTAYFVLQFMITKMFRNQMKAIVAFEAARGVPVTSNTVKNALKAMKPLKAKEFEKAPVKKR